MTDVRNLVLHCLSPFGSALLSHGPGRTFYKGLLQLETGPAIFFVVWGQLQMSPGQRLMVGWQMPGDLSWESGSHLIHILLRNGLLTQCQSSRWKDSVWGGLIQSGNLFGAMPCQSSHGVSGCTLSGSSYYLLHWLHPLFNFTLSYMSDRVHLLFDFYSFTVFRILKQRLYSQTTGLHLKESTRGSGI